MKIFPNLSFEKCMLFFHLQTYAYCRFIDLRRDCLVRPVQVLLVLVAVFHLMDSMRVTV